MIGDLGHGSRLMDVSMIAAVRAAGKRVSVT
jgi:hypothetical protein